MHSVCSGVLEGSHSELEWRARDVHISVPYSHRVDPELVGDEVDGVQSLLLLANIGLGGFPGWRSDHGVQVGHRDPRHLECQATLGANLRDGDGLPHPLDVLRHLLASLSRYRDLEGRSGDVGVSKLDVDDVEAGLGRFVVDVKSSVFIVLAVNLCLGRSLNRERESAVAS